MIHMPKQGATKEEILKLISGGERTLSGISTKLSLAPSTVSKHIHDLEAAGLIEQEDDTHVKKWKYYRIVQRDNAGADVRNYGIGEGIRFNRFNKGMILSLALISMLLVFTAAAVTKLNPSSTVAYVPIGITDPPQVPYGTQALYINYSSLAVLVSNSTSSSWIRVNSSGTLDLIGLVNQSQVIGGVPLRNSQRIVAIAFNITSSSIVIGNITYGVNVQGSRVSADLAGGGKLNASSGILIDFFPVVTPVYGQNAAYFVMLPSMKAIAIPKNVMGAQADGYIAWKQQIPPRYALMLKPLDNNLSISNPVLSVDGNNISLSAYVQNSGAYNVTVLCMMLTRAPGALLPSNSTQQYGYGSRSYVIVVGGGPVASGTLTVPNASEARMASGQAPGMEHGYGWYREYNHTLAINADGVYTASSYYGADSVRILLNHTVNAITINTGSGMPAWDHVFFRMRGPGEPELFWLNLVVGSNGTMFMPQDLPAGTVIDGSLGHVLAAHSVKEFSYNGAHISAPWVPGPMQGNYTLVVVTDKGIVSANVTAK